MKLPAVAEGSNQLNNPYASPQFYQLRETDKTAEIAEGTEERD
jgi:hypothetical protein